MNIDIVLQRLGATIGAQQVEIEAAKAGKRRTQGTVKGETKWQQRYLTQAQ